MKQNKRISFARVLQVSMILVMVMSLLLCGCGKKKQEEENGPANINGFVFGDGDGKVEAQDMVDEATGFYGQLLNMLQGGTASTTVNGMQMNMSVTMGDDLRDTLNMMLAMTEMDMDLEWLEKLEMVMQYAYDGNLMQTGSTIKLNGEELMCAEAILDLLNGMYYVGYPGLSDKYIGMDMSDMATSEEAVDYTAVMQEMMGQMSKYADKMPSEEEVNNVLSRYVNLFIEGMGEPTVEQVKIGHSGVSVNVNANTYALYESNSLRGMEAILLAAQDDAQLKNVLDQLSQALNLAAGENDPNWQEVDLYAMVQASLPAALEEIREELAELEQEQDELLLELVIYTDGDEQVGFSLVTHSVIGSAQKPEVENNGTEVMPVSDVTYKDYTTTIRCYNVRIGHENAFELYVADDIEKITFEISGTGTVRDDLANGKYNVRVDDTTVMILEVVDFDMAALEQGALIGKLRLAPKMDNLNGSLTMFISEPVIELGMNIQADQASLELNLLDDDDLYIGMAIGIKQIHNAEISVPNDYLSADEASMMEWIMSLDFDQLMGNMEDAGVPDSLIDMLESALSGSLG